MGTETRIGIVAGLLIVVIASVYFFYGHEPDGAAVLVVSPTAPPTLPASLDDRSSGAAGTGDAVPSPRPGAKRTAAKNQKQSRPSGGRLQDRLAMNRPTRRAAPTVPSAGDGRSPRESPNRRETPVETTARPAAAGPRSNNDRADASSGDTDSTPVALRSGPSPALREATWDNLVEDPSKSQKKGASPQGAPGLDLRSLGEQFRTMRQGRVSSATGRDGEIGGRRRSMQTDRPGLRSPEGSAKNDLRSTASNRTPAAPDWPKRYVIQEGDTLADLAVQFYDDSRLAGAILAANPKIKSPRHLRIGQQIVIPAPTGPRNAESTGPRHAAPANASAVARRDNDPTTNAQVRTYTVRQGDTLYGIARRTCGDGDRWPEILRLNHALLKGEPKRLSPGMILTLPR